MPCNEIIIEIIILCEYYIVVILFLWCSFCSHNIQWKKKKKTASIFRTFISLHSSLTQHPGQQRNKFTIPLASSLNPWLN